MPSAGPRIFCSLPFDLPWFARRSSVDCPSIFRILPVNLPRLAVGCPSVARRLPVGRPLSSFLNLGSFR